MSNALENLSPEQVHQRRRFLKLALAGGGALAATGLVGASPALAVDQAPSRGVPHPVIKDIRFLPLGENVAIVKVVTDQPGLFGYGDACIGKGMTVEKIIAEYYKPLLMGRDATRIDDIWNYAYFSSYYKNSMNTNAAISGICDALWDIKGKMAGMPVYQLVGGKQRDASDCYMHASAGVDPVKIVENSKRLVEKYGVRNISIADAEQRDAQVKSAGGQDSLDRDLLVRRMWAAYEGFRKGMPDTVRLGSDVHNVLDAQRAVLLCSHIDQYGPWFWIEDPLIPEEQSHFPILRQKTSVPIGLGELWNNPAEWRPAIENRWCDMLHIHTSHIGGFTAGRKVAQYAANFEVAAGWHSTPLSPQGLAANLTLDATADRFGVHEHLPISQAIQDVCKGTVPQIKNGYMWCNDTPGWGIEIDEAAAAKLKVPATEAPTGRENRTPDGAHFFGANSG